MNINSKKKKKRNGVFCLCARNFLVAGMLLLHMALLLIAVTVSSIASLLLQSTLLLQSCGNMASMLTGLRVEQIDLLQREVGCLGVAEVHERDEGIVRAHEDQICLPLKTVDDDGGDHDDDEVLGMALLVWCESGGRFILLEARTQSQLEEIPTAVPLARACKGRISGT